MRYRRSHKQTYSKKKVCGIGVMSVKKVCDIGVMSLVTCIMILSLFNLFLSPSQLARTALVDKATLPSQQVTLLRAYPHDLILWATYLEGKKTNKPFAVSYQSSDSQSSAR